VDSNEDPGRETACPLDLYDRAEQAGVHTELAGRLTVPIESLRQETREFVAYWTIGGGMGQRRTTWVARLRQRLVKRAGEGALKAPGAIAHAATKVAELGSPGAAVAPSKHLAGFVGDERGSS
jgi:hypothetical protein